MVPCERKADLDEFEHGLEFVRSRVNGVLISVCVNENVILQVSSDLKGLNNANQHLNSTLKSINSKFTAQVST